MNDTSSLESYLFHRHRRAELDGATSGRGRDTEVITSDGYPLLATVFDPPPEKDRAARLLVIASATGVRRRYYSAFARWMADRGTRVVTFDYRGIGGSRPAKLQGFEATLLDWAERDLASVVAWAAKRWGEGGTFVVGHSVGGQLLGLLPDPSLVRAVVMVGSGSGDYRLWSGAAERAFYGALWHAVVPGLVSTLGYLPGSLGIGEALPAGVAREWASWCRTPGYVVGGDDGEARRALYRRLDVPVLAFGFDDDDYAPPAAVAALLSLYENARIVRRQIATSEAKVGHFGFFRERFRATLWEETAAFFEAEARQAVG